jgi:group I intron endonuclease
MTQCIYCIENLKNGKKYIGQTIDYKIRSKSHSYFLNRGKHRNPHLGSAWKKDGPENFSFYILEECSFETLTEREAHWISYYQTLNPKYGYNLREASSNGKIAEESKRKMSIAKKGKSRPKEVSDKIRETVARKRVIREKEKEEHLKLFPVIKKKYFCIDCGIEIEKTSGATKRCSPCAREKIKLADRIRNNKKARDLRNSRTQ